MASDTFSVSVIHNTAALSCCTWFIVTLLAHSITSRSWRNYSQLKYRHKLAWCNRIASGVHAVVLVAGQASNMRDPVLNADPLYAVTDGHFFWGSIMYGYLMYDTLYTIMFYNAVGSVAFLLHHCLGLVCCCVGLYFNKMALFGTAIEVFFEGTTPLLHLMGCLKLMGWEGTSSYTVTGMAFVAQFFVCRVVIANYYWVWMISAVAALKTKPAWALGGVAVYGVLTALNLFWFYKLILLAMNAGTKQQPSKPISKLQPSSTTAAAADITAASGQAAAAAGVTDTAQIKKLSQKSQLATGWLQGGKQKTAAADRAGLETPAHPKAKTSDSTDAPNSPRIGAAHVTGSSVKTFGSAVLAGLEERQSVSPKATSPRKPPASPFAAMADQDASSHARAVVAGFGSAVLADWELRQSSTAESHGIGPADARVSKSGFGIGMLADLGMHPSVEISKSGLSSGLSGFGPAVLAGLESHRSTVSEGGKNKYRRASFSVFGPAIVSEWDERRSLSPERTSGVLACIKGAGTGFGPAVLAGLEQRQSAESGRLSEGHMKLL